MGVFNRFIESMRLNPDDEIDEFGYDDDDEFYDDDDAEFLGSKKSSRKERKKSDEDEPVKSKAKGKSSSKITQMRSVKKQGGGGMEVCVIKPSMLDDTKEIAQTLLSNRTVVLNLEELKNDGLAQRIVDITAGVCLAIDGKFRHISDNILIIAPPAMDVSGDFQEFVDSVQTSGLHMDF